MKIFMNELTSLVIIKPLLINHFVANCISNQTQPCCCQRYRAEHKTIPNGLQVAVLVGFFYDCCLHIMDLFISLLCFSLQLIVLLTDWCYAHSAHYMNDESHKINCRTQHELIGKWFVIMIWVECVTRKKLSMALKTVITFDVYQTVF